MNAPFPGILHTFSSVQPDSDTFFGFLLVIRFRPVRLNHKNRFLPRSCFSFSAYYFYYVLDFYSAFLRFDSFYCKNWQNFCRSFWRSLSFFFISSYLDLKETSDLQLIKKYSLNFSFCYSKASWISYIFLLFSRSFVAGDIVSYWLKTGIFDYFFIVCYIFL